MGSSSTDCRTPTGIAVGLLDGIITHSRVLRRFYAANLGQHAAQCALKDLAEDEDFQWLLERLGKGPLHDGTVPAHESGTGRG